MPFAHVGHGRPRIALEYAPQTSHTRRVVAVVARSVSPDMQISALAPWRP